MPPAIGAVPTHAVEPDRAVRLPEAGPPLGLRPIMSQRWCDISFVHWPVAPEAIAPLLPAGVRPDVHDGVAWVGLIPFRMVDAGVGSGPPLPWLGTFLETNVRTYSVDAQGRRGVVFLSLEAQRLLVVAGALLAFGTPYRWASMSLTERGPADAALLTYRTGRLLGRSVTSRMSVRVGPRIAHPDDLSVFLTARFGLHTRWAGRTLWVPNQHPAWPLREATLEHVDDGLVAAAGLDPALVDQAPGSVLFSREVRTVFGRPQLVRA